MHYPRAFEPPARQSFLLKWQVPHGDTPDVVRNHPKLKGMTIPKIGQGGSVGVLVTRTLIVAADPLVTTTPDQD